MHKLLTLTPALLLAASTLAPAQIVPTSPGRQRAANRRALREAKSADTPYKDTHLAVTRQQLKRGQATATAAAADEPRFDRNGAPHVTEPKYPGLQKHRKPKSEPQP